MEAPPDDGQPSATTPAPRLGAKKSPGVSYAIDFRKGEIRKQILDALELRP